jgi:hypothetical protein
VASEPWPGLAFPPWCIQHHHPKANSIKLYNDI